ncbi:hypothetical protein V4P56_04635 [Bartonella sp. B35(2025)]
MNFLSEWARKIRFKLIIFVYIVGSALWGINQYKDKIDLSILKVFNIQDIQDIIDTHLEHEKQVKPITEMPTAPPTQKLAKNKPTLNLQNPALNLQNRALLNNTAIFKGSASITSGVTFKLITPVAESWRTHITRNIHLYGVDTCAPRQKAKLNNQEWPCGAVTTAWLVTKTLGQDLSCKQAIIQNGVYYAQCFVQGIDLAEAGLAEGMLLLSKDNKNPIPTQYLSAEETARNNKIGLWSSDFTEPLQWRRDNGSYNPFENL